MFFFHSLHPKRENIDHNLSKLLQGVSTRNLSYNTKGSTLPRHTPPLYSKPRLQKPTYRLESISGEDQFVFTDDTIPLNSGSNLLQHIQPKRDKRKRKIPSFWSQRAHQSWKPTPPRKKRQPRTADSIPVSVKGLIAEANAGVDQCGATMDRQKIVIRI